MARTDHKAASRSPRADKRKRSRERGGTRSQSRRSSSSSGSAHRPLLDYEEERDKAAGDFISIVLKNLNGQIPLPKLRELICREFQKYRTVSIKIVNKSKARSERICFINFERHVDAKRAKRDNMHKLFYGLPLYIVPVFRRYSEISQMRDDYRARFKPGYGRSLSNKHEYCR